MTRSDTSTYVYGVAATKKETLLGDATYISCAVPYNAQDVLPLIQAVQAYRTYTVYQSCYPYDKHTWLQTLTKGMKNGSQHFGLRSTRHTNHVHRRHRLRHGSPGLAISVGAGADMPVSGSAFSGRNDHIHETRIPITCCVHHRLSLRASFLIFSLSIILITSSASMFLSSRR